MQFNSLNEFLKNIKSISKNNKIYIWGISIYGNLLGKLFYKEGISWDGYYDNFNDTEDHHLNSKPIYKNTDLVSSKNTFFILSMRNYEPVKKQLLSYGIKTEYIIFFENAEILDSLEEIVTIYPASTKQLETLCGTHCGERCFIIGNGPSLCIEDLNSIHNSKMKSFACNLIFKCYDKTPWRPDYYFFTDGAGIRQTFYDVSILKHAAQNCKYIFSRNTGELAKYKNDLDNLILFKQVFSTSEYKFDFSSDCSRKVYIGHSVTYVMLQMAVYMGFKEIYLLGMDHSFSVELDNKQRIVTNDVKNHPDILGNYPIWGLPDTAKISLAYIAAKKYADSHNIKIYNATRGGKLEVFERIAFEKVMEI